MNNTNNELRKEILIILNLLLLILPIVSSNKPLYFTIPLALICFFCELYASVIRYKNKIYKIIFSIFSPFCFLVLYFWSLYLLNDLSSIRSQIKSTYIIIIPIIVILDAWYCSLVKEEPHVTPPISSCKPDTPAQTMNKRIELYNDKFDYMDGSDFEEYCADLLRKNGFTNVTLTSTNCDFGADILATQNKIKYAIQCKCYSSDVGIDAVYQITAGTKYYDANIGIVLTNRYFTRQAIELASKIGIVLWNRDFLVSLVNSKTNEPIITPLAEEPLQEQERDVYFIDAGKVIIEKQKASIGMLQRIFKISFDRAERIMDQLHDAGVVGEYDGIHPRKVLMNIQEFEIYIEKYL